MITLLCAVLNLRITCWPPAVGCLILQVEISNLKTERERIKLVASDGETRIGALEKELDLAKQVSSQCKITHAPWYR